MTVTCIPPEHSERTTPRAASAPQARPPVCVDLRAHQRPVVLSRSGASLPRPQHPGTTHPRPWLPLDGNEPQSSLRTLTLTLTLTLIPTLSPTPSPSPTLTLTR